MRSVLAFLLMLILLFWLAALNSAQARWSIWLYQAQAGRLLRVDNNGAVIATLNLPNPAPSDLVIAPAGDRAAYQLSKQKIIVLDLGNGQIKAEINLSDIGSPANADDRLILGEVAFSTDSQSLIYSEILGGLGWQIQVYDFTTNSISQTLRSNSEVVANFPALHGGIEPKIQAIQGDRISFSADIRQPVGIHSYHWFYLGDILSETVAAPSLDAVNFPYTGDIVLPYWDWRFEANNESFRYDYQQRNSLHAYQMANGRFPIYVEPTLDLEELWFIQGGEKLLIQAYEDEIHSLWLIIGRDGGEVERLNVAGTDIRATPDGFVYKTQVGEQTAVVQVDTRNLANAGTTLWVQPEQWQILWAGSNQPQVELANFAPLAIAYQDPSGVPNLAATPTLLPAYNLFRRVGMPIQVFVPEEGFLNLRDAPSTSGGLITMLESGTRGEIIGGPVEADGLIWWEISVSTRTGWVVESLPEFLALIPPQDLPTPLPTNTATPSR